MNHSGEQELLSSAQVPEPPMYIYTTVSLLYTLIFLCGIMGNALVIFVVCRNKDMRSSTNYFLTNLSVADLMVIIVCMPSSFVELFAKDAWYFGPAMCKYTQYRTVISAGVCRVKLLSGSFRDFNFYFFCNAYCMIIMLLLLLILL